MAQALPPHRPVRQVIFAFVWELVALGCFVAIAFFGAGNTWPILVGFGLLSGLTGASWLFNWSFRTRIILSRVSGTLLVLYCLSLILLGTEDVGGFRVSLPFGLPGIAIGLWSILIPTNGKTDKQRAA